MSNKLRRKSYFQFILYRRATKLPSFQKNSFLIKNVKEKSCSSWRIESWESTEGFVKIAKKLTLVILTISLEVPYTATLYREKLVKRSFAFNRLIIRHFISEKCEMESTVRFSCSRAFVLDFVHSRLKLFFACAFLIWSNSQQKWKFNDTRIKHEAHFSIFTLLLISNFYFFFFILFFLPSRIINIGFFGLEY